MLDLPPGYRPPASAGELLDRYAAGERDFPFASLERADLSDRSLSGVKLQNAECGEASFFRADLSGARLYQTELCRADLRGTNLSGGNLSGAKLHGADLTGANLSGANLFRADLIEVIENDTNWTGCSFHLTALIGVRLVGAIGLDGIRHQGPSTIDHRTLSQSSALPAALLRGTGLADWQIQEANLLQPDLTPHEITDILYRVSELRGAQPLQVRPIFISYSHGDTAFVDHLEAELNGVGIRFWRDIHHLDAGPMEEQIHRALDDRVALVVLSRASTQSDWVQHEVRHARELAKRQKRYTICPIALDDSWKTCAWPARRREQIMEFNVLDFSGWDDRKRMSEMFVRLERGLRKWYR